jgi:hypothetical protein
VNDRAMAVFKDGDRVRLRSDEPAPEAEGEVVGDAVEGRCVVAFPGPDGVGVVVRRDVPEADLVLTKGGGA